MMQNQLALHCSCRDAPDYVGLHSLDERHAPAVHALQHKLMYVDKHTITVLQNRGQTAGGCAGVPGSPC